MGFFSSRKDKPPEIQYDKSWRWGPSTNGGDGVIIDLRYAEATSASQLLHKIDELFSKLKEPAWIEEENPLFSKHWGYRKVSLTDCTVVNISACNLTFPGYKTTGDVVVPTVTLPKAPPLDDAELARVISLFPNVKTLFLKDQSMLTYLGLERALSPLEQLQSVVLGPTLGTQLTPLGVVQLNKKMFNQYGRSPGLNVAMYSM